MRYKEILPKLVVVLFGLTLYFWGVYERSILFSLYGTLANDLTSLCIGVIFCFVLLTANICFGFYCKLKKQNGWFQYSVAMITNGFIASVYLRRVTLSPQEIILWLLQIVRGEFYRSYPESGYHDYLHRTLFLLSAGSILLACAVLIWRNFPWLFVHRFGLTTKLSNK